MNLFETRKRFEEIYSQEELKPQISNLKSQTLIAVESQQPHGLSCHAL